MKLASALPQNSVFFSGGILPPSKSATATVEGATFSAGLGWNEGVVSRATTEGIAAGDALGGALDAKPATGCDAESFLAPQAANSTTPDTPAAAIAGNNRFIAVARIASTANRT